MLLLLLDVPSPSRTTLLVLPRCLHVPCWRRRRRRTGGAREGRGRSAGQRLGGAEVCFEDDKVVGLGIEIWKEGMRVSGARGDA